MKIEELKKIVQEQNIKINNQYFLDEKVLEDFSIETIINKLLMLGRGEAFKLYMNMYQYGNTDAIIDMFKYIIENNFNYFKSEDKKTFSTENIIKEYTSLYSREEHNINKLKQIEVLNISNVKFINAFMSLYLICPSLYNF